MKGVAGKISLISAAAVLALILVLMLCLPTTAKAEEAETEVKYADIYILAGQSNAVGHGPLSQKVKGQDDANYTYRDMISEDDERNQTGYENVYYYGTHDIGATGTDTDALIPQISVTDIKFGLGGGDSNKIGPELGMAKALSETATEDNPAFVFRYASGGTAIGDYLCKSGRYDNLNYIYGGWASPTIKARWESEERKNIAETSDFMYKALLTVVKRGIAEVKKRGYVPVLKGYAWMQGESDSEEKTPKGEISLVEQYEQNLTDFINDLRKDIAELFEDEEAENAAFVIGKISPDYNYSNPYTKKNNTKIRDIQVKVANTLEYCYTIETNDMPLFDSKKGELLGADIAHFNAGDQYTLGQRFANAVKNNNLKYNFCVTAGEGGTAQRNASTDGDKLSFDVKPDEGKTVDKVYINDSETAFTLTDGRVTVTLGGDSDKYNDIKVEFKQNDSGPANTPGDGDGTPAPDKVFPTWAITVIVCAAACIVCAAVAIVLTVKKRNAQKA